MTLSPEELVAAARESRRAGLVAIRDMLAATLGDAGHVPGCSCRCGNRDVGQVVAGDGRVVATVAKQLAAILAELDALPGAVDGEASKVVSLQSRIAEKAAKMGRDSAASV